MNHTPAPWTIRFYESAMSWHPGIYYLGTPDGDKMDDLMDLYLHDNAEANVKLAAAAPEMLEALIISESLLRELETKHSSIGLALREIRIAINKATQ